MVLQKKDTVTTLMGLQSRKGDKYESNNMQTNATLHLCLGPKGRYPIHWMSLQADLISLGKLGKASLRKCHMGTGRPWVQLFFPAPPRAWQTEGWWGGCHCLHWAWSWTPGGKAYKRHRSQEVPNSGRRVGWQCWECGVGGLLQRARGRHSYLKNYKIRQGVTDAENKILDTRG